MALSRLPHRPDVQLLLPHEVRAGGTFEAEVRVNTRRALTVGPIRLEVEGRGVNVGQLLRLHAELHPGGRLPKGETRLRCRATLPETAPPSYRGRFLSVAYRARVLVDIPWWPDRDATFEVPVLPPERPLPNEEPFHFSTRPAGPEPGRPHLEGIIDRRVLALGDVLSGQVSLSNLGVMRYSRLELHVVSRERVGARSAQHQGWIEAQRFSLPLPMPTADGEPVSFRMKLPNLTPSFQSEVGALSWHLLFTARHTRGLLEVPVAIDVRAAASDAIASRLVPALPSIGNARIASLWTSVGAEHGFRFDEGGLVARVDRVRVRVEREHRGRDGIFLVARLEWPAFGLALRGGPRTGIGRFLTQLALEGDTPAGSYLAEHSLEARGSTQARAVARGLFPDPLGALRVAELRDDGAVVERLGGTEDPEALGGFLALLRAFIARVQALPAEVPPPDEAVPYFEAWLAWASASRDRELERATLSGSAQLDGVAYRVGQRWEGARLVGGFIEVRADVPLDPAFVARDTEDLDAVGKLGPEARTFAVALLEVGDLSVREDGVLITLGRGVEDPAAVEGTVRRMAKLAALLRQGAGPYR
ncbi:MAG: hypothetical protein KF901_26480 [Myxococcales bacterium]|nr:hypothetical protein [Myxococcales bacterium]